MFLGHYALGFAAKKGVPRLSLGLLFLATQFVDLLWPLFLLLGLEHVRIVPGVTVVTPLDFYDYPYSHSLAAAVAWSALLGVGIRIAGRTRVEAIIAGLLVLSHWILDLASHRPDLPLAPGTSTMFGLGLWNFPFWTTVVEWGLFGIGVLLYARTTRPRDRQGRFGLWALVGVLAAIAVGNAAGPPPPNVTAIGFAGLGLWIFVLIAFWVDRHRTAT